MKRKWNWLILIAVAAAVIIVWVGNRQGGDGKSPAASGSQEPRPGAEQTAPDESAPKKGSAAPSIELPLLDGTATYSVGGKRDKAVLVNFWASWCGPCDLEAPDLVTLYEKYGGKMDLYAVNATKYDKVRNARVFAREKGFTFPVLTDADGKAGDAYQVFSFPTSFIIDREGRIAERIEGVIPLEKWEELLAKVTS